MVAVARAALIADHRDEIDVVLGRLVEDVVERCPIELMGVEVRCQCSLEGPEPDHGMRAERCEEGVDLRRGGHAATAGIGPPLRGELVRIEAAEHRGHTTDLEALPLGGDGSLTGGGVGEPGRTARARSPSGSHHADIDRARPDGATAVMVVGEVTVKTDEAFGPKSTSVAPVKPDPEMSMLSPPPADPLGGVSVRTETAPLPAAELAPVPEEPVLGGAALAGALAGECTAMTPTSGDP